MADVNTTVEQILRHTGAKRIGEKVRCPAHEDKNPSLSIGQGDDRRILLRCHAGCSTEAVVEALGLTMADLMPDDDGTANRGTARRREMVADYVYTDQQGKPLYRKLRYEPKHFGWQHRNGADQWAHGLGAYTKERRVLYNLPGVTEAVTAGETIYIVEGEKDADRINTDPDLGDRLCATTPGGVNDWQQRYANELKGAQRVVIVQDNDPPGHEAARRIAGDLDGVVGLVEIVKARTGNDASDHLDAGFSLSELVRVRTHNEDGNDANGILATPRVPVRLMSFSDLTQEPKPIPWLVQPWLIDGQVLLFGGEGGCGKSVLVQDLIISLVTGRPFLGLPVQQTRRVLVLDEENDQGTTNLRTVAMARGRGLDPRELDGPLTWVSQEGINLDQEEGRGKFMYALDQAKPDIVVFDSLVRFTGRDENSNSEMADFFATRINPFRRQGITPIFIHHLNKPITNMRGEAMAVLEAYRFRGATEIINFSNMAWGYGATQGTRGRTLAVIKSRVGTRGRKMQIRMEGSENDGTMRLTGEEMVQESPEALRALLLAAIIEAMPEGVLEDGLVKLHGDGKSQSAPAKRARNAILALKKQSKVRAEREGKTNRLFAVVQGSLLPTQTHDVPTE